jgi:tetratricopeptide (TPR) repeat protein
MKADSKSKALADAERCVSLAPEWPKGYSRLGAAQQSLRRFDAAMETFKIAIKLDPNNQSLWSSLKNAEEAYEEDKKQRFAAAAAERAVEENILRMKDEAKRKAAAKKEEELREAKEKDALSDFLNEINSSCIPNSVPENVHNNIETSATSNEEKKTEAPDDSLLSDFFSSVGSVAPVDATTVTNIVPKTLTEKYLNQDLGSAMDQFTRLTGPNYKWKNLNPYYVMDLDIDATDEDIKYRYIKLTIKYYILL